MPMELRSNGSDHWAAREFAALPVEMLSVSLP